MGINPADPEDFQVIPGRGVVARSNSQRLVLGTRDLLQEQGVDVLPSAQEAISRLENEGKTALPLALNGHLVGLLGVADTPRS
jgi:Cu+-exporting ATPase